MAKRWRGDVARQGFEEGWHGPMMTCGDAACAAAAPILVAKCRSPLHQAISSAAVLSLSRWRLFTIPPMPLVICLCVYPLMSLPGRLSV